MNRLNTVIAVFLFAGLSACASQPVADKYYSLVLAADNGATPATEATIEATVVVGPVELPAYLNQRGLVMQTASNQVQTANHHFWAEPLDEAIAKVLVRDISQQSRSINVQRDAGRWSGAANCRIRFEFDKFHATSESRVVMSGRYWISNETAADATISREFSQSKVLSADGYAQAVTALRAILLQLARGVSDMLQDTAHCLTQE